MAKTVAVLREELMAGKYDQTFAELYMDKTLAEGQRVRYIAALDEFEKLYGDLEVEVYSAPGRSEVGGNHTDHQHGMVLATSVNIDTIAVVAATDDGIVDMKSEGYDRLTVDLGDLEVDEAAFGTTGSLIKGMAAGLKKRGYEIGGLKAFATSQVLSGSGLSSSAAFEVLIGNILFGIYNEGEPDAILIAQIGQEAENQYFGKPCGLMDQMACSVGGLVHIDFKDPSQPIVSRVDVDFASFHASLCILDTKGSHADLTDEYAAIPTEMKQVASFFGQSVLRDVDESEFYANIPELREKFGDRGVIRAIHFFNENRRADVERRALLDGDYETFVKTVKESGDSSYKFLQNVYANHKVQEQSVSVALAISEQILSGGKGVCRVHGGGFAGTIQAFVLDEYVEEYKMKTEKVFGEGACQVLKVRSVGGCKVL